MGERKESKRVASKRAALEGPDDRPPREIGGEPLDDAKK